MNALPVGMSLRRFSLRRLIVAVVFLAVFVGLNVQKIGPVSMPTIMTCYRGWPLPFTAERDVYDLLVRMHETESHKERLLFADPAYIERREAAALYQFPWTHKQYELLRMESFRWLGSKQGLVLCGLMDALFALVLLFMILFFRISGRKVPGEVSEDQVLGGKRQQDCCDGQAR